MGIGRGDEWERSREEELWEVECEERSEMRNGAKESNGFLLVEVVVGPICHRHYKVQRHRWEDIVFHLVRDEDVPVHSTLGKAEPRIRCHLQAKWASLLEKESIRSETVYTMLQILKSWIHIAQQMLKHVTELVKAQKFEKAASDCYLIERIWKLLSEIEFLLEFGFVFIFCVWLTRKINCRVCVFVFGWQEIARKSYKIWVCDSYI